MKKLRFPNHRRTQLTLGLIIVAVVGLAYWGWTVHQRRATPVIPTAKAPVYQAAANSDKVAATPVAPSSKQNAAPANSGSSVNLIAPYGTFVSNHKPGQNGTGNDELSTCTTSPGAYCDIQFSQGSTVKKLGAKQTDSSGVVSWAWDVKDAGFTAGNWKITAIATSGTQSKNTDDQLALEVQP